MAACPVSRCWAEIRTLACEAGSKNQNERPSRSTRFPASRGGSTYWRRFLKCPEPSSFEKSTKPLCDRSCPEMYSVKVSVVRNGCSGLRILSEAATISCALCASASAPCTASSTQRTIPIGLNMAKCIHDGEPRGAVGGNDGSGHRHHGEHDPRAR